MASGKTFSCDSENHLMSMTNGSTSASIIYDGDGNRVAKTVGGVTTYYLVDDLNPTGYAQVVDELTGSTVSRIYTYGLQRIDENQPISGSWTPSFYGYDGGGNVRQLTSTAGTVTDSYEYDAYGNHWTVNGSTPNNMLYRGEEYDSDLGLVYLRARYMNPLTGRFVSRDPGDGELINPETLHKYFYANAEPVNGFDPTGWEDAVAYPLIPSRVSASAATVYAVHATGVAIACLYLWDATKFYAETQAGLNGTVVMVAPCIWMARWKQPDDPKWTFKQWLENDGLPPPPSPPTRCEKVRAECQAYCWESVQFRKGNRQGALRRCTRLCMEGQGCYDY